MKINRSSYNNNKNDVIGNPFFYLTQIHKKNLQTCIINIVFYGNTQINCKARKENVKFRTKVDLHDFIIFIFVYDKNQRFSC